MCGRHPTRVAIARPRRTNAVSLSQLDMHGRSREDAGGLCCPKLHTPGCAALVRRRGLFLFGHHEVRDLRRRSLDAHEPAAEQILLRPAVLCGRHQSRRRNAFSSRDSALQTPLTYLSVISELSPCPAGSGYMHPSFSTCQCELPPGDGVTVAPSFSNARRMSRKRGGIEWAPDLQHCHGLRPRDRRHFEPCLGHARSRLSAAGSRMRGRVQFLPSEDRDALSRQ